MSTIVTNKTKLREEYLERLQFLVCCPNEGELSKAKMNRWRKIVALMDLLRLSTVEVVESIIEWRRGNGLPYIYEGSNYLTRIPTDLDYINKHDKNLTAWLGVTLLRNPFIQNVGLDHQMKEDNKNSTQWRGANNVDQKRIKKCVLLIIEEEKLHGRHISDMTSIVRFKLISALYNNQGTISHTLFSTSCKSHLNIIYTKRFRQILRRRKCRMLPIEIEWLLSRVCNRKGHICIAKLLKFLHPAKRSDSVNTDDTLSIEYNKNNSTSISTGKIGNSNDETSNSCIHKYSQFPKFDFDKVCDKIRETKRRLENLKRRIIKCEKQVTKLDLSNFKNLSIEFINTMGDGNNKNKDGGINYPKLNEADIKWRKMCFNKRMHKVKTTKLNCRKKMRMLEYKLNTLTMEKQDISKEIIRRNKMIKVISRRLQTDSITQNTSGGQLKRFQQTEKYRELKMAKFSQKIEAQKKRDQLLKQREEIARGQVRTWHYRQYMKSKQITADWHGTNTTTDNSTQIDYLVVSKSKRQSLKPRRCTNNGYLISASVAKQNGIQVTAVNIRTQCMYRLYIPRKRAIRICECRDENELLAQLKLQKNKIISSNSSSLSSSPSQRKTNINSKSLGSLLLQMNLNSYMQYIVVSRVFIVEDIYNGNTRNTLESNIRFPVNSQRLMVNSVPLCMRVWEGYITLGPLVIPCTANEVKFDGGAFNIQAVSSITGATLHLYAETPGGHQGHGKWTSSALFSAIGLHWKIVKNRKIRALCITHPMTRRICLSTNLVTEIILNGRLVFIRIHQFHSREIIVVPFDSSYCTLPWFTVKICKFQKYPTWHCGSLVNLVKHLSWNQSGSRLIFSKKIKNTSRSLFGRTRNKMMLKETFDQAISLNEISGSTDSQEQKINDIPHGRSGASNILLRQATMISGMYCIVLISDNSENITKKTKEGAWLAATVVEPKSGSIMELPMSPERLILLAKNISPTRFLYYSNRVESTDNFVNSSVSSKFSNANVITNLNNTKKSAAKGLDLNFKILHPKNRKSLAALTLSSLRIIQHPNGYLSLASITYPHEVEKAAVNIQSLFRGRLGRVRARRKRLRVSATRIQNH